MERENGKSKLERKKQIADFSPILLSNFRIQFSSF